MYGSCCTALVDEWRGLSTGVSGVGVMQDIDSEQQDFLARLASQGSITAVGLQMSTCRTRSHCILRKPRCRGWWSKNLCLARQGGFSSRGRLPCCLDARRGKTCKTYYEKYENLYENDCTHKRMNLMSRGGCRSPFSDRLSRSIGLPLASRLSGPITVHCTDLSGAWCQISHVWQMSLCGASRPNLVAASTRLISHNSQREKKELRFQGSKEGLTGTDSRGTLDRWKFYSSTIHFFTIYGRYVWLRNLWVMVYRKSDKINTFSNINGSRTGPHV